ncbi:MAG: HAD hydrolase-like protein [Alphaproteobacteria bacterium]|nr:HAD hydrolase-like protein [Rhodospirillales bacterium]MCW9045489.1 HAD hydrolase-like protein [Alphaproteobacteria bacterium]
MSLDDIKALTFDTGGTILDWHSGFRGALAKLGAKYGVEKDWGELANEMRRQSLGKMINLGEHEAPAYNFDGGHRMALDAVLAANGLDAATEEERHSICWDTAHNFQCWPDFPGTLPKLRNKYICASFTILSFRIIIDTAKRNGLSWDAVISCEAIGKYKMLPEAYQTAAKYLQLDPSECCMVACHNFDLDAAKKVGFKTAFVRRPDEWGPSGPPDPTPNPEHDIIVDTFPELAETLGVK